MGLMLEREKDGRWAIVTGSEDAAHVVVPEMWQGLPVREIGSHAFAGKKEIKSIALPGSIFHIGSYAFYNCSSLERLTLTDSVEDYDGGAIRECISLKVIELHAPHGNYRVLKDMIGDSGAELHAHVWMPEGEVDLIFPAYYDEFREDTHARDFHYHIIGAGLGYREVVRRREIDLLDYDRKFATVTSMPGTWLTACRIACGRLLWPVKLLPRRREDYLSYLKMHSQELLMYLSRHHEVEKAAQVMDLLHVNVPSAGNSTFDLGDL